MKRKLLIAITILLCLCAVFVLASCSSILDLIFGPNPSDSDGNNQHVHVMKSKSYTGQVCTGQEETISYFKCSGCGKCYLDKDGVQLIDEASLDTGHKYVYIVTDTEHYLECDLCSSEQQGSRQAHSSDNWLYSATEHYRLCDVCDTEFDQGSHDPNVNCDVCGRKAYVAMCSSSYGYDRLQDEFDSYVNMQKLYNKIDQEVEYAHNNANRNFNKELITKDVYEPALSINCSAYNLTIGEVCAVLATYRHDHPIYYWLLAHIGYVDNTITGYTTTINVCVSRDYANGSDRVAANAKVYSAIDKYLSYVANQTDPYEIALTLHNKIITNIDYAYQSNGQPQQEDWAHSVVGVFNKNSAVCDGYAKAFQLLLNACGVNNLYVNGYVNNDPDEGHAWNLVQLSNEQWYWYDLTWDDQPSTFSGVIYNYCCKSSKEFGDHTVNTNSDGINYLYGLPTVADEAYRKNTHLFPFL